MAKRLNVLPCPARRPRLTKCALLEGDADGWIACCSSCFLPLARRMVQDEALAEDTLQISWIKVLQSVHRARFKDPVACRWVRTIVSRTAKDISRQRRRRGEVPLVQLEALGPSPEEVIQEQRRIVQMRETIPHLPKAYREVIDLRVSKGYSARQTAHLLGISRSAVSTRLNRAVRMLRQRLDARLQPAPRRATKTKG